MPLKWIPKYKSELLDMLNKGMTKEVIEELVRRLK